MAEVWDAQTEIELIRALCSRSATRAEDVEGALEQGFGKLMTLEAYLQRLPADAPEGARQAVRHEIERLTEALADLRRIHGSEGPAIAHGFVIPARTPQERRKR